MAEKSAKKKTKKAAKGTADPSVLGNLSATRPTRIGGERRAGATRTAASAATTASAAKTATATQPKAAPKKAKATAPKATTTSAPKDAEAKAAKLRKPAPAPPAGWQTPPEDGDRDSSGGVVTTAVQAAGELAQLGATIGGQLVKRAARRIPRP
jgi:hypothetical protein